MVYVDPLFEHGGSKTFKWKVSCHMFADTDKELHAMAKKIGMKREWHQQGSISHYDLVPSRRKRAVMLGAKEVTFRQAVEIWRK